MILLLASNQDVDRQLILPNAVQSREDTETLTSLLTADT